MLRRIRDTLYEGSWEDFAADLRARLRGEPYVFEIVPPTSSAVRESIARHLRMIEELLAGERAAMVDHSKPNRGGD
jgi:hypothetical protein